MFRVIVAGSREFTDRDYCFKMLDKIFSKHLPDQIICGCAKGADTLGEEWGDEHEIPVFLEPACWDVYGKRAGYIRNEAMAKHAEALIAFWDGESRGTKHMINIARERGLKIIVVNYKEKKFFKYE